MSPQGSARTPAPPLDLWVAGGLFGTALLIYILTLAPGLVFGDPSEYTFVPAIGGIAHPPGYAFQTVVGGLWQRLVPFGTVAYRANLLSAAAGAALTALVYGATRQLMPDLPGLPRTDARAHLPGVIAALTASGAAAIWQHSLHANAHIITAVFAALSLFLLLRWEQEGGAGPGPGDRWLYGFCLVAGLGITHHPLTVFSFPAYAVFILSVRPGLIINPALRSAIVSPRLLLDAGTWSVLIRKPGVLIGEWRVVLAMAGWGVLGLLPWLYLPIRASLPPALLFGPDNTDTLSGFLDLVLARGLRVNLFAFGWADQPGRLIVLYSLLRLQTSLPFILLMLAGLAWLWRRRWRAALLFSLMLLTTLGFILNSIQDVWAYFMTPLVPLVILCGAGVTAFVAEVRLPSSLENRLMQLMALGLALAAAVGRIALSADFITLRDQTEAAVWVEEVYGTFEGRGEGAILLAHWEHLTPLWYAQWVEGRPLAPADVTPVFVAANSPTPWLDNTLAFIAEGPLYVSGYQRELAEAGFRLRPTTGRMYRVLPSPATAIPDLSTPLAARAGPVEVVGVDLAQGAIDPGGIIRLSIAMRVEASTTDIIFPYAVLGEPVTEMPVLPPVVRELNAEGEYDPLPAIPFTSVFYGYTTDSYLLTPAWQPGEIIMERYDARAPLYAPPGRYPLWLGLRNLSTGETLRFADGEPLLRLGEITLTDRPFYLTLDEAEYLANIAYRVGLMSVAASARGQRRYDTWQEPLRVHPGDTINLRLTWATIHPPDENWKVFVHLVGPGNRVYAQQDAPPLGGAFPTYLWFPKWVIGQSVIDPYRLVVPADAPSGDYYIAVGMYGFTTFQRADFYDVRGNLTGDQFILGGVLVE